MKASLLILALASASAMASPQQTVSNANGIVARSGELNSRQVSVPAPVGEVIGDIVNKPAPPKETVGNTPSALDDENVKTPPVPGDGGAVVDIPLPFPPNNDEPAPAPQQPDPAPRPQIPEPPIPSSTPEEGPVVDVPKPAPPPPSPPAPAPEPAPAPAPPAPVPQPERPERTPTEPGQEDGRPPRIPVPEEPAGNTGAGRGGNTPGEQGPGPQPGANTPADGGLGRDITFAASSAPDSPVASPVAFSTAVAVPVAAVSPRPFVAAPAAPVVGSPTAIDVNNANNDAPVVNPKIGPQQSAEKNSSSSSMPTSTLAGILSGVGVACVAGLAAAGLIVKRRKAANSKAAAFPYRGHSSNHSHNGNSDSKSYSSYVGNARNANMGETDAPPGFYDPSLDRALYNAFPAAYNRESQYDSTYAHHVEMAPPAMRMDLKQPIDLPPVEITRGSLFNDGTIERAVTGVIDRNRQAQLSFLAASQSKGLAQHLDPERYQDRTSTASSVISGGQLPPILDRDSLYSQLHGMDNKYTRGATAAPVKQPLTVRNQPSQDTIVHVPAAVAATTASETPSEHRQSVMSTASTSSWLSDYTDYTVDYLSDLPPRESFDRQSRDDQEQPLPQSPSSDNTFGTIPQPRPPAVRHPAHHQSTLMTALNHIGSHANFEGFEDDDDADNSDSQSVETDTTITRPSKNPLRTDTFRSQDTSVAESFATAAESIRSGNSTRSR
ncbi:hypothetical protein DFJ77DRAFT_455124 [Powellomyces hirtus]|nr:hypothetical protein DFJ77DRAFT_455124 [Powellomyces hirtus]